MVKTLRGRVALVGGVSRGAEVMSEIAAASEQQTEGVAQISQAVEEMNGVPQTTAASAGGSERPGAVRTRRVAELRAV